LLPLFAYISINRKTGRKVGGTGMIFIILLIIGIHLMVDLAIAWNILTKQVGLFGPSGAEECSHECSACQLREPGTPTPLPRRGPNTGSGWSCLVGGSGVPPAPAEGRRDARTTKWDARTTMQTPSTGPCIREPKALDYGLEEEVVIRHSSGFFSDASLMKSSL